MLVGFPNRRTTFVSKCSNADHRLIVAMETVESSIR